MDDLKNVESGMSSLRHRALLCLAQTDPSSKVQAVMDLYASWHLADLTLHTNQAPLLNVDIPGRPIKPDLVPPLQVKRRSMNTVEGRAALIHALAHIEFNAINLALDAVWRFNDMPSDYYVDWLQVAKEEAYHFTLLEAHLKKMGYQYGDFSAHDSLWELTDKTKGDVLARMALVPRTMEARGLDATPPIRAKIAQAGDHEAAAILDIILRDEIGHVAIGNRWFAYLCQQRQCEPMTTFTQLARQFNAPSLRPPFNEAARLQAGFTVEELETMQLPR